MVGWLLQAVCGAADAASGVEPLGVFPRRLVAHGRQHDEQWEQRWTQQRDPPRQHDRQSQESVDAVVQLWGPIQ